MNPWKFASFIEVDKEYRIAGLNIWNFYWACSDRKVEVNDPIEGQVYFFNEYEITEDNQKICFVAGEFSNKKVGLYLKDEYMDGKLL
ncbi:MAG: hypothetical protein H7195_00175 [Chryseobacterium sp.]|nr:hypothetical protein [Chryseobacterium sp.]